MADSDDPGRTPPRKRRMKSSVPLRELESLDIFDITDDMGSDSECGGDSEADDILDFSRLPRTSTPLSSPTVQDLPSTSTVRVNEGRPLRTRGEHVTQSKPDYGISDEDSDIVDDSDADPDFDGDPRPRLSTGQLFEQLSDSDSGSLNNENAIEPSQQPSDEIDPLQSFHFTKHRVQPKTFNNFVFNQPMGLKVPIEIQSPKKIFLTIIEPFLDTIVEQSNLFAHQHNTNLELTKEELLAFIGILVMMGYHVLPSMRLYWSSDPTFNVEAISKIMSLRRFLLIIRFLHLNDNTKMPKRGEPNYDKLYKVRPMITFLKDKYHQLFNPSRFLSIDESMIGFKGRSTLKQYLPNKPTKRGFKVWVICCAVTGFMIDFNVYEGKSSKSTEETLGEHVVLSLATVFENLGYCLFFDRFFSNLPLIKKLLLKRLFACGTIRSDRKYFPKNLLKKDNALKTGDSDFAANGEISVAKWKDRGRKSVQIASNMHDPEEFTTVDRRDKCGEKIRIQCPKAIADYNLYMGGVDHFDHLLSSYSIIQKSRRWWLKIFYFLLESAIVNSFILYKYEKKEKREKPFTQLKFRTSLACDLIGNYTSRKSSKSGWTQGKKTGEKTVVMMDSKEVGLHLPVATSCRRCARCSTKKNVKRSSIGCEKCEVALCLPCFAPFHRNK